MSDIKTIQKKLINTRLLKSYGGWMYCDKCNNTMGYLCYSTYDYFRFYFVCNCGEHGSVEIGEDKSLKSKDDEVLSQGNNTAIEKLFVRKGRLCCPKDQSPLFSIVEKNLQEYDYKVICKECLSTFYAGK